MKMDLSAGHVWVMISAALVLLMTPGVAFFYGGMTRAKAALNMMMMSFVSIGLVGVVWVLWGFSMTGGDGVGGLFGNPFTSFGLEDADRHRGPHRRRLRRHLRHHHRRPDQRRHC